MKKFFTTALAAFLCIAHAGASTHIHLQLPGQPTARLSATMAKAQNATDEDTTQTPRQWQSLGTAMYTDDILSKIFDTQPASYSVEVEKDVANEGFYRIVEPIRSNPDIEKYNYYVCHDDVTRYMVIDASDPDFVIIEPTYLGIKYNEEEYYMYSYSWLTKTGDLSKAVVENLGFTGKLNDGIISFTTPGSLWITQPSLDKDGQGYTGNPNGAWRLELPDAKDYSIELNSCSWCSVDGKALVAAQAGADVADIIVGTVTDLNDHDQIVAVLKNHARLTPQQETFIALPTDIKPCRPVYIVAFSFDADGNSQDFDYTTVYAPDTTAGWRDLPSKALFYDFTITHAYDLTPGEIEVDVQEDVNTPGRYRIVNPFKNFEGNVLSTATHGSHDHYIYFDASNPDCVIVEEGPVGYRTDDDGEVRIASRASQLLAQGKTKAEIRDLSYGGILKNGRITFPYVAHIYLGFIAEGADYWMNVNFTDLQGSYTSGPMYLDLTEVLGIDDPAIDPDDTSATFYNLQGMPIATPEPGQIVIRRTADSAAKILFQ